MSFKFENLSVWQQAMDLGEDLNSLISQFPEREKFNLSSQVMRAVDSVALNISEGSIGQSDPEFNRFLGYSVRSLAEVVTCLHKAKRREYISSQQFDETYGNCFGLMNMLVAFRRKLK